MEIHILICISFLNYFYNCLVKSLSKNFLELNGNSKLTFTKINYLFYEIIAAIN